MSLPQEPDASPPDVPRRSRVLIVDDEDLMRRFAKHVLVSEGYEAVVASDGSHALEVAARYDGFDLLLTDLMMPGMCGDAVAARLREASPRLKVLYLTGFADRLFESRVSLRDDEAFLEKPCGPRA